LILKRETGTHAIKVKLSRQDNILSDIAARFPPSGVSIFKRLPARAADQSDRLDGPAILAPMPNANPFFAHIHLLFALLNRVFALWTHGKPPVRLQRLMERTGRALADDIRATLTEDGVAFPALDDRAFLKWFAKTAPGLGPQSIPGTRRGRVSGTHCHMSREWVPVLASGQTGNGSNLDRRLPAGWRLTGNGAGVPTPSLHHARAPP
jgi:hypothetical protein